MSKERTLAEMEADPEVRAMFRRISVSKCFTLEAVYEAFVEAQRNLRFDHTNTKGCSNGQ